MGPLLQGFKNDVKVSSGVAVLFEGSTGAGSTSKLTHMVDGRI